MAVFDGGIFDSGVFDAGSSSVTVGADLALNYKIKEAVGKSATLDYHLGVVPVSSDVTLDYRITYSVGSNLGIDHQIIAGVGKSQTLDWKLGVLRKDLTLDYVTYNEIGKDLVLDSQTIAPVGSDVTLDYQIDPKAWVMLMLDYKIAGATVGKDLTADYRILEAAGKDLTLDYANSGSTIARKDLTLDYEILSPRKIVIRYGDVDVTPYLVYNQCEFISLTNGSVGTASILLIDRPFIWNFSVGAPLKLYISDNLVWSGYTTKVNREYPFQYENLQGDVQRLPRYLRIEAVDLNILLEKRITMKNTAPATLSGPMFESDYTPDIDAIRLLCDGWLDLSLDDIDTVSMVDNVSYINIDQPANAWQAGIKWREAMMSIANLPGAVFYITPDRKLVYTDVDNATNPMVLTDMPDQVANGVGYRSFRWLAKGEKMCNDYLAWGLAQAPVVFVRESEQALIDLHGRWQDSQLNYSVYKQATINKVAEAYVSGSPANHRGHKDDYPQITCTTYTDGFQPAQKVRVISNVHGLDDVIPIRMLRITFPSPTAPRYDLTLSHEIDAYSLFDVIKIGDYEGRKPQKPPKPPVIEPVIPDPRCYTLDSFSRFTNYTWHPDHAEAPWTSTGGWGQGEHLNWDVNGIPFYVGGAGMIDVKCPEWPDPRSFGAPYYKASAPMPANISAQSIVVRFSIERLDRILPAEAMTYTWTENTAGFGPGYWLPETLSGGNDWEPPPAFQGWGAPHWGTYAVIRASVVGGDAYGGWVASPPGGLAINKTLYRGSLSNLSQWAWSETNPGPWHNNPGGFFPGITTYAGGSKVAYGYYPSVQWYEPHTGLAYRGQKQVSDFFFAGPDNTNFSFNQGVGVTIGIRGYGWAQTFTIGKEAGPVTMANGGPTGSAFGVSTTGGTFSDSLSKFIEPGFPYYIRWYRPTRYDSYVKVWGEHESEPTEWQAFSANHPPYVYDTEGNLVPWPAGKPPVTPMTGGSFVVEAQAYHMQQYQVRVDGIWACEELVDSGVVPIPAPNIPSGTPHREIIRQIGASPGLKAIVPYVPGSLMLWCNGLVQRKGVDFVETSPSEGTFTLLFTPDEGDKIIIRYYTA